MSEMSAANDNFRQAANDDSAQDSSDLAGKAASANDASPEANGGRAASYAPEAGEVGPPKVEVTAQKVPEKDTAARAGDQEGAKSATYDNFRRAANDDSAQDSSDLAGKAASANDASLEANGGRPASYAPEAGERGPAEIRTSSNAEQPGGKVAADADDELTRLINEQKADKDAQFRGETGLEHGDEDSLPDETIPQGDEPGRIAELDSREPSRPDPERMQQGNDFDSAQRGVYTADQLRLENGRFLDSYTPGAEIVSRKHTQLAEISPAQAEKHVNEILDKYAPGNTISDTPANNARYPELVGQQLAGEMVLEVPIQDAPVPPEFGDWAARMGVTIRDFNGQILNDIPQR
jgi:hypothetical protein